MAKKQTGVFGAMGNLFRWTIYGLAAVLLFAIYLGWSGQEGEEVATAPDAETPVAPVEEPVEDAGSDMEDGEDEATNVETAVRDAEDAVSDAVDAVTDEAEEAVEEVVDQARTELEAATESAMTEAEAMVDDVEQGIAAVTDQARDAVSDIAGALGDALPSDDSAEDSVPDVSAVSEDALEDADRPGPDPSVTGETASGQALSETDTTVDSPTELSTFTVPGDDATYSLQSAFKRDDGNIEFTTERTGSDGAAQTVTRLVSCAPLAVGIISEGDGATTDQPDMEPLVLGSTKASIAAVACGVFR